MIVDENIFVMLLVEERLKDFINGEIADANTTEAITCLPADIAPTIGGSPFPRTDRG